MPVIPTRAPDSQEASRLAALGSYAIAGTAPEAAYDDIVHLACLVCATPVAALSLVDRDRQWLKASIGVDCLELPRSESICSIAIRTPGEVLEIRDLLEDPATPMRPVTSTGEPLRFYAGVPVLSADGHPLGTLCVLDRVPRVLEPGQREALKALARQTQHLFELRRHVLLHGRVLDERDAFARKLQDDRNELQRRHDDLQRVASHDPLTGLLNRRALEQLRERPEAMRRLEAGGYALAIVDIDYFKQVNDRHGHLLGDRALAAVGEVIRGCIRDGDVAVRYGGEEFLLVLPNTRLPGAFEVAERVRTQMATLALPFPVTVSVGVAAGDPQHDTPEQVFDRADQALYRAKAGGRNQVLADDTQRV